MRLAIISDIHGNLPALEAVLKDARCQGVDEILCLGDVALKGPCPSECCDLLDNRKIRTVAGNNDLDVLNAVGIAGMPDGVNSKAWPEAARPYLNWHLSRMPERSLQFLASLSLSLKLSGGGEDVYLATRHRLA